MLEHILVTGGAGFVGRNLIKRLTETERAQVIWCIDDLSTGILPENWPELKVQLHEEEAEYQDYINENHPGTKIRFIKMDVLAVFLGEMEKVPSILQLKLPQMNEVYHLASIVGGRAKIDGDPLAVGLDLGIDAAFFLWAAKVNRPNRILYASSSAAYPVNLQAENQNVALKEDMIDFEKGLSSPDFTYGWSKLTGEYLSRIAHKNYNLNVAVVRPFSGYGEYQEPVYPVPAIAMRAAAKYDPLYVWGTGEQSRDFVHIEDCITCMILAIEKIVDGTGVNIGSGVATSFLELAALFADILGYKPEVTGLAGKPVGVAKRFCDPSSAKEKLDFYPTISIREGMRRVLQVATQRISDGMPIPE